MLDYDLIRLKHIRDASEEIVNLVMNKTKKDLYNDRVLSLALVRLLEIVGEASAKLSKSFLEEYSNIRWAAIIGMRNRLIHGYFDVDLDVVWKTVTQSIPALLDKVTEIIETNHQKK